MAQSIKDRVFGSDVPPSLKQKIQLRQAASQTSNADVIADILNSVDNFDPTLGSYVRNFKHTAGTKNDFSIADLSSRTPFARMWVALKIVHDLPSPTTTEPTIIEKGKGVEAWNTKKKN